MASGSESFQMQSIDEALYEEREVLSIESSLKLWREKIIAMKRKEITPGELTSLMQQESLQHAFFSIIDRDMNGSISLEEWTGCFSKILGESDIDVQKMNWFVDRFHTQCDADSTTYLSEMNFKAIVSDVEFGYRFASVIAPKSRRVNTVQLITSLEIIASMSSDSKWLSWLKFQFTEAMRRGNRQNNMALHVTLNDFTENFHFKEPFLAERLFHYLDKDQSGTLSLHEFINGLEVIVNGTREAKIEFLFKCFDLDGDERIEYAELRMMLKCCLEETPSLDMDETVDDLAAVLFKQMDRDQSGDITLHELKLAFRFHEPLFNSMSVSTSVWIKPKYISRSQRDTAPLCRLRAAFVNQRQTFVFWLVYFCIHTACMLYAWYHYANESRYVITARMFGNALNFNSSLVLALVLRKHITWLRIKGAGRYLPFDDFIDIHRKIGVVILVETVVHTAAHLVNLYTVCVEKRINYLTALLTGVIDIGYPTGVVLTVLLVVIIVFGSSFVRERGYFQLFYWFHMLTIPWLVIMLKHCPRFWIWLLLPGFCYAVEKIMRFRKVNSDSYGDTMISEAVVLPSKVVHLVVRKPEKFRFKPGDYVFVNIPAIAKFEWHPFSISSAPEKSDCIWLHVRACGNWTRKLYSYSLSSKFDVSGTSHSSLSRINMRYRMSCAFAHDNDMRAALSIHEPKLKLMQPPPPPPPPQAQQQQELSYGEQARNKLSLIKRFNNKSKVAAAEADSVAPNQLQMSKKVVSFFSNPLALQNADTAAALVAETPVMTTATTTTTTETVQVASQQQNLDSPTSQDQQVASVARELQPPPSTMTTAAAMTASNSSSSCSIVPLKHKGILKLLNSENRATNPGHMESTDIGDGLMHRSPNALQPSESTPMKASNEQLDGGDQTRAIAATTAVPRFNLNNTTQSHDDDDYNHDDDVNDNDNDNDNAAVAFKCRETPSSAKITKHEQEQLATATGRLGKSVELACIEKCKWKSVDSALRNSKVSSSAGKPIAPRRVEVKSLDQVGCEPHNRNLASGYFSAKEEKRIQINKISQVLVEGSEQQQQQQQQQQQEEHEAAASQLDGQQQVMIAINDDEDELQQQKEKRKMSVMENVNEMVNNLDVLGYVKMYNKTAKVTADSVGPEKLWRLQCYIDGPYGTSSQDIFDSEHAVLVAAGIGITPFASILQSLMFRYRQARATCPSCDAKLSDQYVSDENRLSMRKVDFIWITREQRSLEWFISMLSHMEIEQRKNGEAFMETHLYVTSAKRRSDLRSIDLHLALDVLLSKEETSLLDGLRQRTHYGRPNWDIVLQTLIRKKKGKINLFYCGPPSLANVLQDKCLEYSLNFKKEVF